MTVERRGFALANLPRTPIIEKSKMFAVWERFLADPSGTDLSFLRPVIARSWQRSVLCKVNPQKPVMDSLAEPQIDEQFLRLAEPVLQDLEKLASDAGGCIALSDAASTLAVFRGDTSAVRWADKIFPINGGCMSEDIVGTNSDGTAIEEGRAVQVWAGEHFNETLKGTCCTSVPIRDPLRRSIRGVLSLTLPERIVQGVDPRSILLIVQGAAAEISAALTASMAVREQALLSEYLREVRKRGADAVVAVDNRMTIASRGATQLLDQSDYAVLTAYARDIRSSGEAIGHELWCSPERALRLHVRPIQHDNPDAGSVIRISKLDGEQKQLVRSSVRNAVQQFEGFVGNSAQLRRALETACTAASRSLPAYIVGEAGTGKRQLGCAIANALSPKAHFYDCGALGIGEPWEADTLVHELENGASVLLHQVETLAPHFVADLLEVLSKVDQPKLVITMRKITETIRPLLLALRGIEVQMPSLRMRREDIPVLANHFLTERGIAKKVAPRLMTVLAAAEWPGNVRQLKEVIDTAAVKAVGREVKLEDLSDLHRQALSRNRLSRLQKAELDQIREALAEVDGNRLKAAAILRIGRSTLYRKIDSYTSRGFALEE